MPAATRWKVAIVGQILKFWPMTELVLKITQEADGGFVAEALDESIITQADTWEELHRKVRVAVTAFFFERPAPQRLRLPGIG